MLCVINFTIFYSRKTNKEGESDSLLKLLQYETHINRSRGGVEFMSLIENAVFEPNPGDRIRILIEYKGTWRALFWVKVASDGSVYLGPRIKKPKTIKKGRSIANNGTISVNYSDGVEVEIDKQPNKAKFSFHASGIINNLINERSIRSSLRDIQEQEHLCTILFYHPDKFEEISIEKIKKRDICLRYPIEDDYPIMMNVFIAPTQKLQLVNMVTEKQQLNIVLLYKNLQNISDMAVQLSIFTPAKGPWPPYTYVLYPTKE
jgi:hypothetical protein